LLLVVLPLLFTACQRSSADNGSSDSAVEPEAKLKELNLVLPAAPAVVANYVGAVRTGDLVFLAGAGALDANGKFLTGRLGENYTIEQGYEAARLTGLVQLATLKAEIGDLNRVKRIVKVLGMVNSTPSFTDQPKVINGFSDLMVQVFGDRGKHARSAVGMAVLPFNIPVEVEMIVEVS
jgi:enamine deaminase RidA (YjgF/YER057c/UK114 family)